PRPLLTFSPAIRDEGHYTFDGTEDGRPFSCTATVATKASSTRSTTDVSVDFGAASASPAPVIGLGFSAGPKQVALRVERDGESIGGGDIEFTHVQDEGCPSSCGPDPQTLTLSTSDGGN